MTAARDRLGRGCRESRGDRSESSLPRPAHRSQRSARWAPQTVVTATFAAFAAFAFAFVAANGVTWVRQLNSSEFVRSSTIVKLCLEPPPWVPIAFSFVSFESSPRRVNLRQSTHIFLTFSDFSMQPVTTVSGQVNLSCSGTGSTFNIHAAASSSWSPDVQINATNIESDGCVAIRTSVNPDDTTLEFNDPSDSNYDYVKFCASPTAPATSDDHVDLISYAATETRQNDLIGYVDGNTTEYTTRKGYIDGNVTAVDTYTTQATSIEDGSFITNVGTGTAPATGTCPPSYLLTWKGSGSGWECSPYPDT